MSYFVITIILIFFILITVFLIKESYSSRKGTILSMIISAIACIITLISSLVSKEYLNDTYTNEISGDNTEIISNNSTIQNYYQDQIIIFDNFPCFVLSKNYEDTEVQNNGTEFIFYNHSNEANNYNMVTFSFDIERYNFFSVGIKINDNINSEENIQTTIEFYTDRYDLIYNEILNNENPSSHIYMNVSSLSVLTIAIKTNMIETEDDIFRTVSFYDINID